MDYFMSHKSYFSLLPILINIRNWNVRRLVDFWHNQMFSYHVLPKFSPTVITLKKSITMSLTTSAHNKGSARMSNPKADRS